MTTARGANPDGALLAGTSLCPGQASGIARWVDQETWNEPPRRIDRQAVARELNAFRHALICAQRDGQNSLPTWMGSGDSVPSCLRNHLHALSDAVWIADVESLVLAEHFDARSAVHKVLADAQRVAHVVGDDEHRRRARRVSSVGRCVLEGLDRGLGAAGLRAPGMGEVLLAQDKLLLADLMPAGPSHPVAVVCTPGQIGDELEPWLLARGVAAVELDPGEPIPFKSGDRLVVNAKEPGARAEVACDRAQPGPVRD